MSQLIILLSQHNILYLCIVPNKSFNPEIGGPLPPYPLYLLYGRFLKSYTKITKNFRLFFAKNNGCYPNLLSNSHLAICKV